MGCANRTQEAMAQTPEASRTPEPGLTFGSAPGAIPEAALELPKSPESPVAQWLDQLIDGDFHHRWEVSKSLKASPQEALEPLLELLVSVEDDEELLWFIARLLGEIDHPQAVQALAQLLRQTEAPELQSIAALALANRGAGALPVLADLLIAPQTRLLAVQVLAQLDCPGGVELLLGVVQDEALLVRTAALEALSGFWDSRIAPVLLAALQDPQGAVRAVAVRSLGARASHLPGVALDGAIAPLLDDLNLEVATSAIAALGRLDSPLTRQALAALWEPDPVARPWVIQCQAIRALGWSQSPEAIALLLDRLRRSLLAQRAEPPAPEVLNRQPSQNQNMIQEIIVVLGRLRPPQDCAQAAEGLAAVLPLLFDCLSERGPDGGPEQGRPKAAIALALGQLGQPQSFEALWPCLADDAPGLRFHVVAALKRLDSEAGQARLQRALAEQPSGSRLAEGLAIALSEWP